MNRIIPGRLLEIQSIFSKVVENEVSKYYYSKHKPYESYKEKKSCITLWSDDGDAYFCDKYILLGNGNGTNNALDRILGKSQPHSYSNMLIFGDGNKVCWLNLPHPMGIAHGIGNDSRICSFIEFTFESPDSNTGEGTRFDDVEILESDSFKQFIFMFIKDVAPENLSKIQKILT